MLFDDTKQALYRIAVGAVPWELWLGWPFMSCWAMC